MRISALFEQPNGARWLIIDNLLCNNDYGLVELWAGDILAGYHSDWVEVWKFWSGNCVQ